MNVEPEQLAEYTASDDSLDYLCPINYDNTRISDIVRNRIHHKTNGLSRDQHLVMPDGLDDEEEVAYYSAYFDAIFAPYLLKLEPSIDDNDDIMHQKDHSRLVASYVLRYLCGESLRDLRSEPDSQSISGYWFHESIKRVVTEATRSFAQHE